MLTITTTTSTTTIDNDDRRDQDDSANIKKKNDIPDVIKKARCIAGQRNKSPNPKQINHTRERCKDNVSPMDHLLEQMERFQANSRKRNVSKKTAIEFLQQQIQLLQTAPTKQQATKTKAKYTEDDTYRMAPPKMIDEMHQ